MKITFSTEANGAFILLLSSERLQSENLPEELSSGFSAFAENIDFKADVGQSLVIPLANGATGVIIGTGQEVISTLDIRRIGGCIGDTLRKKGLSEASLSVQSIAALSQRSSHKMEIVAQLLATQVSVGNYRYDRYKSKPKSAISSLIIVGNENALLSTAFTKGLALADARNFARDLVNAPAADIYPASLAEEAISLADDNISVEVWGMEKLRQEKMVGTVAVGQGSINEPRFIHLHYKPATESPGRKKLGLIGKGVTFDAGGLSIKPSSGMQTMRCDMAGSAAVLGAFHAIRSLKPDVEVHGLIGAAENMVGANSFKLGDILTYRNGTTVEIHNTDAEGRLVMADCLAYGSELGLDQMIDLATLTGACVVALGDYYSGLFTNDEGLSQALLSSADSADEGLWRMPLPDLYKPMLKAEWADIKNIGGRYAGAITAGLFLSHFVGDTPWAHIDIAGPAFLDKPFRHFCSGGTGAMVETLSEWFESSSV